MSCFEVLYRGALRAALHMNLNATTATTKPTPCPVPPPPPPPPPPPCPACEMPKSEPPKPASADRRWFIGAGGLVGFGIAPEIAAGMQIMVGWRPTSSWSFEVHAGAALPDDTRPLGPTVVRVHTITSLAIAPCYRFGSLGACWLVAGGAMAFESLNVTRPHVGFAPLVATGPHVFFEHRLSDRWSVRGDADIVLPLFSPEIRDNASKDRWRPTPITGSASVSLLVQF